MVVNVFISAVTTDTLSRKDAIAWVNDRLKSHMTKVEEMASGAAYCQLTHMLFRDGINLKKVKFNPRNEPDVLNNWKVLTTSWKNIGIDKPVDVEKLKKAKFQDNMEFLQWFHKFYNANYAGEEDYDAVAARGGEDLPALKGPGGVSRPIAAPVRPVAPRPTVTTTTRAPPTSISVAPTKAAAPKPTAPSNVQRSNSQQDTALLKENEALKSKVAEQESDINLWMENAKEMENERDHYYSLLRKVEELLVRSEEDGLKSLDIAVIKSTLYDEAPANDENEEIEHQTNGKIENEVIDGVVDDGETF